MKTILLIVVLTLMTFSVNAERQKQNDCVKADRGVSQHSQTHNVPDTGSTASLLLIGFGVLALAHKKISLSQ